MPDEDGNDEDKNYCVCSCVLTFAKKEKDNILFYGIKIVSKAN